MPVYHSSLTLKTKAGDISTLEVGTVDDDIVHNQHTIIVKINEIYSPIWKAKDSDLEAFALEILQQLGYSIKPF